MTNQLFVMMVLIHFLADFGLQTHDQAVNKSSSNKFLFYHVGVYSLIWLVATFATIGWKSLLFATITFAAHFTTDYITSRISKPFFAKQDFHNGFVVVGFDQLLHMIQLYFTIKLLF